MIDKGKKYKLTVDCGKPYEYFVDADKLLDELKELEARCVDEKPVCCDVFVFDDEDIDVTDEVFKEYRRRKNV